MEIWRGLLAAMLLCTTCLTAHAKQEEKTRVLILMFDGVEIIDFAGPYEVFGQAGFEVHTVSRDGKKVKSAMGLSVNVDYSFDNAPAADIITVPGGNVQDTAKDSATLAWIRERAEPAKQVLSICTGADILASTGLLDGHSATTFHNNFDRMEKAFPKVTVVRDKRWVDAGKLVTSAGLASGIDAALHVVANIKGMNAARSTALHLEYDWSAESGFIRGLMADQFSRMPSPEITFPEGTHFEKSSSVGDKTYWETDYEVSSPLGPTAMLALMRTHAQKDPALKVLPLPDPMQLAWQYKSKRGGHWRLSFKATDAQADGRYRIVAKVMNLY